MSAWFKLLSFISVVPGAFVLAIASGCGHDMPVEIDLTAMSLTVADDAKPTLLVRETTAGHRRLVEPAGGTVDLFVRAPHGAHLRFTLDPKTASSAFAVSLRSGASDRALAPRRVGEGDWDAALDVEDGAIVRLRLENRGATPLAWWGLRLVGTDRPGAPVLDPALRPPAGPLNVIVVLVDALRADHLGIYGYRRPTAPELGRLVAAHGVVFDRAYAPAPSAMSSIPALFSARHPSAVGVIFRSVPGGTDRTLAEAFSLAGTHTAAFVAHPRLAADVGYGRGFGAYEILHSDGTHSHFARAATLVDRALEYLAVNRDARCFVYVHLMDTHSPYEPPAPQRGRFERDGSPRPETPSRPTERVPTSASKPPSPEPWLPPAYEDENVDPDRYDEAILAVDAQIGRLVRGLEPLGMRDRTAVVVTADHGEALGVEDDGSILHGHALYEEQTHVPLVLLLPWQEGERRVPEIVSLVDLAPTLLDLAGLPSPTSFAGASLFTSARTAEPPAALLERFDASPGSGGIVERGMREGPWKLLLDAQRARLFDLVADPKETTDVSAAHPDVTGYLVGRIGSSTEAAADDRARTIDSGGTPERSLGESLKTLGYLGESSDDR